MDEHPASEDVFRGRRITVRVETLPKPNGGTSRFEIVQTADAVAIVAVRRGASGGHDVLLVRQLRPAVGRELWEIPAGIMDHPDEREPEATAARELAEETGYAAGELRLLARELPSPGFSTEAISIFLATDVHPAPGAAAGAPADPTEIARVRWVPLAEALRAVKSGALDDGKTVLGLTLAAATLGELGNEGGSAMQREAAGMPMGGAGKRRRDDDNAVTDGSGLAKDATLKLDNILLEEYEYAATTAYQSMEDRARMFNLYLLLVGVMASALGAIYQLAKPSDPTAAREINTLIVTLLGVAGVLGFAFFAKIIRLRSAFRDSVITMNVIKEFYIREFKRQVPHVEHAFRWRLRTVPAGERVGSVTFLICYTIAFLASLCFAGAAFVLYSFNTANAAVAGLPLPPNVQPFALAGLVFAVVLLLQILYYVTKLNKHNEQEALTKIEEQTKQDERAEAHGG